MVPQISFLIPTWNGASILERCIEAACAAGQGLDYEVVVCDNGSRDETPQLLERLQGRIPRLRWFHNQENLMFARAVNQLAAAARGEHLLLLNNDVFLEPGAVRAMLDELEHGERVGAVAPQLRYPDGRVQPSCRRLPTIPRMWVDGLRLHPLFPGRGWKMQEFDHRFRRAVEQPMMSALLIRGGCWRDVGPLDEGFPLYFNDVDWCKRALERGWEIVFTPAARGVHLEAWSGKRLGFRQVWWSAKGLHRYFLKHHISSRLSPRYPLLLLPCGGRSGLWTPRRAVGAG